MLPIDVTERGDAGYEKMSKKNVVSEVTMGRVEAGDSIGRIYDDIESAWSRLRPDLDMTMVCTLLRLERVNQLHEMRVQAIS